QALVMINACLDITIDAHTRARIGFTATSLDIQRYLASTEQATNAIGNIPGNLAIQVLACSFAAGDRPQIIGGEINIACTAHIGITLDVYRCSIVDCGVGGNIAYWECCLIP